MKKLISLPVIIIVLFIFSSCVNDDLKTPDDSPLLDTVQSIEKDSIDLLIEESMDEFLMTNDSNHLRNLMINEIIYVTKISKVWTKSVLNERVDNDSRFYDLILTLIGQTSSISTIDVHIVRIHFGNIKRKPHIDNEELHLYRPLDQYETIIDLFRDGVNQSVYYGIFYDTRIKADIVGYSDVNSSKEILNEKPCSQAPK